MYDCFFSPKILSSVAAWKIQRDAVNDLPQRDAQKTGKRRDWAGV